MEGAKELSLQIGIKMVLVGEIPMCVVYIGSVFLWTQETSLLGTTVFFIAQLCYLGTV